MKAVRFVELILHIAVTITGISLIIKGIKAFNSYDFDTASDGGLFIFLGIVLIGFGNILLVVIFAIISAATIRNVSENNVKVEPTPKVEERKVSESNNLDNNLSDLGKNFGAAISSIVAGVANAANNNQKKPIKRYKYCTYCDSRVEEEINVCPYCGAHDFTEAKAE